MNEEANNRIKFETILDKHNIPVEDRPAMLAFMEEGKDENDFVLDKLNGHPNYQAAVDEAFSITVEALHSLGRAVNEQEKLFSARTSKAPSVRRPYRVQFEEILDRHNIPVEDRPAMLAFMEKGKDENGLILDKLNSHPNYQAAVNEAFSITVEALHQLGREIR
jgi:hypothetical protein